MGSLQSQVSVACFLLDRVAHRLMADLLLSSSLGWEPLLSLYVLSLSFTLDQESLADWLLNEPSYNSFPHLLVRACAAEASDALPSSFTAAVFWLCLYRSGRFRAYLGRLRDLQRRLLGQGLGREEGGGLAPAVLARLQRACLRGEAEEVKEPCAVCLAPPLAGEHWLWLPCGHAFHAAPCAARWLHDHHTCPLCTAPVQLPTPRFP